MERDRATHQPVMVDRVTALLAVRDEEDVTRSASPQGERRHGSREEDVTRSASPQGERRHGSQLLVDCTIGAAGHAAALLAASDERTHLLGLDRDPDALELASRRLVAYRDRVTLVHAPFDELAAHAAGLVERVGPVAGVLYDLGVSSMQLDRAERGFSFRADAPLDMRMDPTAGRTAADLVNSLDRDALADVLRRLGEERYAGRIAAAVVARRPLRTTAELAEVVAAAVPAAAGRQQVHPATRTFQALRIAVNEELDRLSASLPQALELAAPAPGRRGGRVAVLSYHSLEDRIAKRTFAEAARACSCPPDLPVCVCGRVPLVRPLIRGVERPGADEVARNRRARSARLRAVERIAPAAQGAD